MEADGAFVGTVVRRSEDRIAFRVERVIKGTVAAEIELPNPLTAIRLDAPVGERLGLLLVAEGFAYVTNGCLRMGAEDLIAAAVPPPCATGDPVAGRFADGLRPRVLACARPPGGAGFQLVGHRRRSGAACLTVVTLPRGARRRAWISVGGATGSAACGDGRVRGNGPLDVDAIDGRVVTGRTPARLGFPRPFTTYAVQLPRGPGRRGRVPRLVGERGAHRARGANA